MTEEEIKQATCKILTENELGDTSGSGWLISEELVLTTFHCVNGAIPNNAKIVAKFNINGSIIEQEATPDLSDEFNDVCLLRIKTPLTIPPIPISLKRPRPGVAWHSFGFPAVKIDLGHILYGTIQQSLSSCIHGIDLELSVDQPCTLTNYQGLSGSPLMCQNQCIGLLRINIDNNLGAISMEAISNFLCQKGLIPSETQAQMADIFAERPNFNSILETNILNKGGGYIFIEGAHGIGKSTYCKNFTPQSSKIESLGIYSFSEEIGGPTYSYRAQPEIFHDWVQSLESMLATGTPARLREYSYTKLLEATNQAFQSIANRCAQKNKIGFLFIDGINEIAANSSDSLKRFADLLPPILPQGLVIAVTGVGLDALADKLYHIFSNSTRLSLPALDREAQQKLCYSIIRKELISPKVIANLCDRSNGHPLYLRYLIDFINGGASQEDIDSIPPFSGTIQDYYESIWIQIQNDTNAINLLGIIARLRWGILISDLRVMFTDSECLSLIPTIGRIRHLLTSSEKAEAYHPSFSEFIIHKTELLSKWIHGRLVEFCALPASGNYGTLNKIYHGLCGDIDNNYYAIKECNQPWVDKCVMLGVEPDLLLSDIENTLSTATKIGTTINIINILLLFQRITFRYNTLFAQSASIVAQSLITLDQDRLALRHISRYGQLIIGTEDAFIVANCLIQAGKPSHAERVLYMLDQELLTKLSKQTDIDTFVTIITDRFHGFALLKAAGYGDHTQDLFCSIVDNVLRNPNNNISIETQKLIVETFLGSMLGSELCIESKYKSMSQRGFPPEADPHLLLQTILTGLAYAHIYASIHEVTLKKDALQNILIDIENYFYSSFPVEQKNSFILDLLIISGASPTLVKLYADGIELSTDISLFTKDKAIPDINTFNKSYTELRAAYFLKKISIQPIPQKVSPETWENDIITIAKTMAWCDASARLATATNDTSELKSLETYLNKTLLPCLKFSLMSRSKWGSSYTIPEHIIPLLYNYLTNLYLDCFPDSIVSLLNFITQSFNEQLGLYNEGFRRSLDAVISQCVTSNLSCSVTDEVFNMLYLWRDYIRDEVQNRYELVPELLHMIPMFSRMDSLDEARKTYHSALSASMGPSWYKEDQLSIMTDTLKALSPNADIPSSILQQIAAYLERASGEMTFQRYVRFVKAEFIGALCQRGLYAGAVRYFEHQSCGTTEELFDQASTGRLDRISPFVGMRFPGGALDEQSALLQLIKNTNDRADWHLRWALLKIYQHGDERHLEDWGKAFAIIIHEVETNPTDLEWSTNEICIIAKSFENDHKQRFLQSVLKFLSNTDSTAFDLLQQKLKTLLSCENFESPISTSNEGETQDVKDTNNLNADKEDDLSNRSIMPGLFGQRSALSTAKQHIETAQNYIKRHNSSAAIKSCLSALKVIQDAEWNVWGNNEIATTADKLISQLTLSADDVTKIYGPLILAERHTAFWNIADHIIELVGAKVDPAHQSQLLMAATNHIKEIIGDTPVDAFAYIQKSEFCTASSAFLELLLWTLDHPNQKRRSGGASMLLWLIESSDVYLEEMIHLAASLDPRNRANVASEVLDHLSQAAPLETWIRIEPHLNAHKISLECKHLGRFSAFLRIAMRASKMNNASADAAVKILQSNHPATTHANSKHAAPHKGFIPSCLFNVWNALRNEGLLTITTLQYFEAALTKECHPLSIYEMRELEFLTSLGAREDTSAVGRWANKILYALHIALYMALPIDSILKVDALIRSHLTRNYEL